MARKNENRVRSKTVSFYVTPLEHTELMARIKVSGMPKGEYFIQSLLHQKIEIYVGKYQSDRLALELKKLRETLETITDIDDMNGYQYSDDRVNYVPAGVANNHDPCHHPHGGPNVGY